MDGRRAADRYAAPALAVLVTTVALASAAEADAAPGSLPTRAEQILFVGDSITAGMYFFAHSDAYAAQGWAGQLMRRLGLEPDRPRLDDPFPLDYLSLATDGFGAAGWRYPWNAIPALRRRGSLFAGGEPRSIVAVPGQTLGEILRQSSVNRGEASTGWALGALLLPSGRTALETAELAARDPEWVVLFAGGNDALSYFGMVGSARPPHPDAFAADYAEAASRLRAVMHPGVPPDRLLLATIPDVSTMPLLQPVPSGSVDERGKSLPAGAMASAFLRPRRGTRYERAELWAPRELEEIRALVASYNDAIRDIARRNGHTVVDVAELTRELSEDPRFGAADSPYFSPDLHHPSMTTHGRIAELVLDTMTRLAGEDPPAPPPPEIVPLPHAGDFTADERERVDLLMRVSLLTARTGHFPPRPTARLGLEAGGGLGSARAGDASLAVLAQLESSPGPVTDRWLSRGVIGARLAAAFSDGDRPRIPERARDLRAGIALEPLGHWRWKRLEAGVRYGWAGGLSWYGRGEWSRLRVELGGGPVAPGRLVIGLGLDWLAGRPGHNGN